MLRPFALALAVLAAAAPAAAAHDKPPDAEIFATNNTALITDPDDPRLDARLNGFARRVTRIIDEGGGTPRGSQLLDGVFFSSDLGGTTFERSRAFDVDHVSDGELHDIAETIRRRFLQQSVLTFDHLPRHDPDADAIELEVPGVTAQALRDGLLADADARERLFGGSVTLDGHLLLVADRADTQLARDVRRADRRQPPPRRDELRRARVRRGGHRRPRAGRAPHADHHRRRRGRHDRAARGAAARDRLRRRRRRRLRRQPAAVHRHPRRGRRGLRPSRARRLACRRRGRPRRPLPVRLRRAARRHRPGRSRRDHRRRPLRHRRAGGAPRPRRGRRLGRPRDRQHLE